MPKFVAIIQDLLAKQNLQGPGLETKIAACAKNRYQIMGTRPRSLIKATPKTLAKQKNKKSRQNSKRRS